MNTLCVKLFIFIFQCIAPTHLLGVRYDSVNNLIHDILLYASTQGYAACRLRTKKISLCTSLRLYVSV